MSSIASRKFTEKDKKELNDSYNRFTGRSRTVEQFEWEWLNTPEGWASIWVLEESDTGKIVGQHGMIPIRFSFFGKSILTGKTENTHLHPPYVGKGLYYPSEVKFLDEARERFALLYTTGAYGAARGVREKLGYTIVGSYANYMKVIKWSNSSKWLAGVIKTIVHNKLIAALLIGTFQLGSVALMPFFSRKGPTDKVVILDRVTNIDTVAEELDKFWERNKEKFGVTAERNSRYLKWRIFDNPNIAYQFFLARKQGEVVGYAITRSFGERGVTITDIIASDNNEVIFNTILDGVVNILKESGVSVVHITTLLSHNFLNQSLRRNGFISLYTLEKAIRKIVKNDASLLMVKSLDNSLDPAKVSDPACWYFTDILTEGFQQYRDAFRLKG